MSAQSLIHSTAMPDSSVEVRLAAARAGDHEAFARLVEPYHRAIQLHCYQMLGSLQDAEDVLQVTLLRAWQNLATFEGRASLKTWLYRIATNACLDALDKRRRRGLPTASTAPADPAAHIEPPSTEPVWLEPYPDDLLPDTITGPEARYLEKETVSLAFLTALQVLPPRQRAVLILADVLDWHAAEIARLLELSVSAVNSALHRARNSLGQRYRREPRQASEATRHLLRRYVEAWERADVAGLTALLKEDAAFSMPPSPTWFLGLEAIRVALAATVFQGFTPGDWLLRSTRANGQPALVTYKRAKDGVYACFGIQVISTAPTRRGEQIESIITFLTPGLATRFGLPVELESAALRS